MVMKLPNYDFLQLEDVNQTLYNYARDLFDRWYSVNIPYLLRTTGLTGDFSDVRYDFVLVSREGDKWTLEICNTFWTGNWKVIDEDGNLVNNDVAVDYYDVHGDEVMFYGSNLENYKIYFQLAPFDVGRSISSNPIYFERNGYNVTTQFSTTTNQVVKIIDKNGNPVEGATVKLVPLTELNKPIPSTLETSTGYNYLKSSYGITGSDGTCKIRLEKTPRPINQKCVLTATFEGETAHTFLNNARIQQYTRQLAISDTESGITSLDDLWMYKGEIKTFHFKVNPINKYGFGYVDKAVNSSVDIYHTYDENQNTPNTQNNVQKLVTKRYTVRTDSNGEFTFKLNGRGFYADTSSIKIVLPETDKYESLISDTFTVKHHWFYANDYEHLRSECEKTDGCDAIILRNRRYDRHDNHYIKIKRKQYIIGEKGSEYPTLNSNHYKDLFMVTRGKGTDKELLNELTLLQVKIINTNNTIQQWEYTNVNLIGCVFENCMGQVNPYQGAIVYQKNKECSTNVQHCYFVNNFCNCIVGRGKVFIQSSLFKITDTKYTPKQEPIIVNQFDGEAILQNNMLYMNSSMEYSDGKKIIKSVPDVVSNDKMSVYCGSTATINGKNIYELEADNSLNFFDEPYNNRAFLFSIYYDYYSNIKNVTVACARDEIHIDNCTAHGIEGSDTLYKDGYMLVRESTKTYIDSNPHIHIQNGKIIEDEHIYVPTSGGIITLTSEIPYNKDRMG